MKLNYEKILLHILSDAALHSIRFEDNFKTVAMEVWADHWLSIRDEIPKVILLFKGVDEFSFIQRDPNLKVLHFDGYKLTKKEKYRLEAWYHQGDPKLVLSFSEVRVLSEKGYWPELEEQN